MRPKEPDKRMRRNVKRYYVFRVLCTMNFVMPVFMLFLIDKGLSMSQIFVTQAAYTLAELLLTVPSGVFADKMGRKTTLILSSAVFSMAFVSYGFSGTFVQVLLSEMLFAVSSASFQGTGEAFLYDALAEARQEKFYRKVLGTAYAIQSFVMGVCAVAGGMMAKHDLALPFFVSAFPAALSMIPVFMLEEPSRSRPEVRSYLKFMKDAAVFVAGRRRLRNIMYYVCVMSLAGFSAWMLYQPLLTGMGLRLEYLGVVMMAMSVFHGVGNRLAHRIEERLGGHDLMFWLSGVRAVLYVLVYLAGGCYLVVWAFLADLVAGVSSTLLPEWVNRHARSENRATVLSLVSMSECMSITLFSPLVGMYVDASSSQAAFLPLAVMLGVYAVRQLVMVLLRKRAA